MIQRPVRRRFAAHAAAAALLTFVAAASACAQPGGGGARQQTSAAAPAVPPDSVIARADRARQKGPRDARVQVVEISDFQCPYCRQFFQSTYRQFDSAYVKTGKVRLVYINLPLSMHLQAFAAAKAATCAGAQGKFWEMHDRLFGTQEQWAGKPDAAQRFTQMAANLGLDASQYRDCVENDRTGALIVNDVSEASAAGIRGTPTFIINGRQMLSGAVPFEQLSAAIEAQLNGTAPAPPPAP